jgi:NAD(P)-dependent dehydrogenase (short-subunit alcohol dehydrogenase family)
MRFGRCAAGLPCLVDVTGHTELPSDDFRPAHWERHRFALSEDLGKRLATRCTWVTGAGTGFGRAVATALGLIGARVVLTGRRAQKLDETVSEARRLGVPESRFRTLPLDLTKAAAVDAAVTELRGEGVIGLVHCAAVPQPRESQFPLLSTTSLKQVMTSNLEAAWLASRAAVTVGAERHEVRVVLFSSEAGWHFTSGFGPYNISKAAMNTLGGSLAAEAAALHSSCDVQINILNPGEARSEMNQGSDRSPYTAVPITLALLGQPSGGPNGYCFHADGRHLTWGSAQAWPRPLLPPRMDGPPQLIHELSGYNIVAYRGTFFGLPQSLGDLRLETQPQLPSSVICGVTQQELEARIRSQANNRSADTGSVDPPPQKR